MHTFKVPNYLKFFFWVLVVFYPQTTELKTKQRITFSGLQTQQ